MTRIGIPNGKGPFVRRRELPGILRQLLAESRNEDSSALNSATHCLVENKTGGERNQFCVLKLGKALITQDDDEDVFQFGDALHAGEAIDEDDIASIYILQEPASTDGTLTIAVHGGVTLARLTGETGKQHATTKEGQYALEASDSGPCSILYDPGPAGQERIARVRIGGSGSSASMVVFRVDEFDEETRCSAVATVLATLCGGDAPGEITVVDLMGCWFANANPDEVTNSVGVAVRMELTNAGKEEFDEGCIETDPYNPYEEAKCIWMVTTLCCSNAFGPILTIT